MKKIILTISAISSFIIGGIAQTPDFNFESWVNVFGSTTIQDPQGFASLNTLVNFGGAQSVFKETTAPFAGTASAKITTVKVMGAQIPSPYGTGNLDTAGLLVAGKINISPPGIKYGYNYTWRPAVLSFQSKYSPMAGDTAFVLVYLTKWNGTSRDTIAVGKYATGANTSTYSLNSITMAYNPALNSVAPDTEQVFISSSIFNHFGAKIGSAFYIDDMAWSGWNSVNDVNGEINTVTVYPNPATDNINFSSTIDATIIEISDITGRLLGSYSMSNNKVNIGTSGFSPGIYTYSIFDKKKEIISRGRFDIAK